MFSRQISSKDDAMLVIANTPSTAISDSAMALGVDLGLTSEASLVLDGSGGVFIQVNAPERGYWLDERQLIALAKAILAR
jgi:hypothetical protein